MFKINKTYSVTGFIIVGIVMFTILTISRGTSFRNNNVVSSENPIYRKIMNVNIDENYPQTPGALMDLNCEIINYLYGGNVDSDKIYDVVEVQRRLFSEKLLEVNSSIEVQVSAIKMELEHFKEQNVKFISVKRDEPVFDDDDSKFCTVKVTQYSNSKFNTYSSYNLIKENGTWKIIGWETLDNESSDEINE